MKSNKECIKMVPIWPFPRVGDLVPLWVGLVSYVSPQGWVHADSIGTWLACPEGVALPHLSPATVVSGLLPTVPIFSPKMVPILGGTEDPKFNPNVGWDHSLLQFISNWCGGICFVCGRFRIWSYTTEINEYCWNDENLSSVSLCLTSIKHELRNINPMKVKSPSW